MKRNQSDMRPGVGWELKGVSDPSCQAFGPALMSGNAMKYGSYSRIVRTIGHARWAQASLRECLKRHPAAMWSPAGCRSQVGWPKPKHEVGFRATDDTTHSCMECDTGIQKKNGGRRRGPENVVVPWRHGHGTGQARPGQAKEPRNAQEEAAVAFCQAHTSQMPYVAIIKATRR